MTFQRILSISWSLIMDQEQKQGVGGGWSAGFVLVHWVYLQLWHAADQLVW